MNKHISIVLISLLGVFTHTGCNKASPDSLTVKGKDVQPAAFTGVWYNMSKSNKILGQITLLEDGILLSRDPTGKPDAERYATTYWKVQDGIFTMTVIGKPNTDLPPSMVFTKEVVSINSEELIMRDEKGQSITWKRLSGQDSPQNLHPDIFLGLWYSNNTQLSLSGNGGLVACNKNGQPNSEIYANSFWKVEGDTFTITVAAKPGSTLPSHMVFTEALGFGDPIPLSQPNVKFFSQKLTSVNRNAVIMQNENGERTTWKRK